MITKKHFVKMAAVFKELKKNAPIAGYNDQVINVFIDIAKSNNPNFDQNTFRRACGYDEDQIEQMHN